MNGPLWKGQPEAQLAATAAMLADTRDSSLRNARWSREIADDCERQLAKIGYGGWAAIHLLDMDSTDAYAPNFEAWSDR